MRKTFVSDDHQETFDREGFVGVPLLSPDELRYLAEEVRTLRPGDDFRRRQKHRFGFTSLTYHCTFLDESVEYKRRTRDLIFELLAPHVRETLVGYEFLNASFYVKPPGSGVFQVHQNWPHLADMADTTISIWCPLIDTDRQNGTLEVIPSSHKVFTDVACTNMPPFFNDFVQTLIGDYLQPLPTKAGESLFFDDNLIHWSSQNQSSEARIAIQAILLPAGTQPVYYHFDSANPERFELFEIDADYFVTHTANDLGRIPKERRSLGYVPNPNRLVTEREFARRLDEARVRRGAKPAARSLPSASCGSR